MRERERERERERVTLTLQFLVHACICQRNRKTNRKGWINKYILNRMAHLRKQTIQDGLVHIPLKTKGNEPKS